MTNRTTVLSSSMLLFLLLLLVPSLNAQSVGINTTTPDASAALDVTSTTQGMLVPRLTTIQRTAISTPATGLLVFDSTTSTFWFYNGTAWTEITVGITSPWTTLGGDIYKNNSGGVGIGTSDPTALLHVYGGNFLNTGTFGSPPSLSSSGTGTRMFFYPKKAAFRAGYAAGTVWDDNNIGNYSIALGNGPKASGDHAIALGYQSQATGEKSFAVGEAASASAIRAIALGYHSNATGENSVAVGESAFASASHAIALGYHSNATGEKSFAVGESAVASASHAIALGYHSNATGEKSLASGESSVASGKNSVVLGYFATALSFGETVFGQFNTSYSPASTTDWNTADRLFSIGNGTAPTSTSDALVVLKSGNVGIGSSTPTNKLEISGTTKTTNLQITSGATSNYLLQSDASGNGTWVDPSTLSTTNWTTSGSNQYSTLSGNVGIGTTSPSSKLDIQSTSSVTANVQSSGSTAYVKTAAPSGSETGLLFSTYSSGSTSNRWQFGKDNGTESGSNAGSNFFINRYTDAGVFLGQPLRIARSTGYVGIGGVSASTELEVNGTTKTTNFQMTNGAITNNILQSDASGNGSWVSPSTLSITESDPQVSSTTTNVVPKWNGTTLTDGLIYDGGTYVGIGTTTPATKLQVTSTEFNVARVQGSSITGTWLNLQNTTVGGTTWNLISTGSGNSEGAGNFLLHSPNNGPVMTVLSASGNVGIGSTSPTQAKLVVNGSASTNPGTYGYLNSSGSIGTNSGTNTYSIYASARIAASEFNAFSDARIKNIQGISNSYADLKTLLGIEITDYKLKDYIGKGNTIYKKVIAQQVEKVYPQAVSTMTDVVPDIYQLAEIKDGYITLTNTLKVGDKVKLIFGERTELVSVTAADVKGFKVNLPDQGKVFVYGREVNDFHTVDYEALSMLNISATQELVKMINHQSEAINALQTANASLKGDVELIKSALHLNTTATEK